MPSGVSFETVDHILVEVAPGPVVSLKKAMADKARRLGGDAILQFVTGHKPRIGIFKFGFVARYGSGRVVKITENREEVMSKFQLDMY